MTSEIIGNKADFQRHLNGCERRLNELTKSLQNVEKLAQKLLLKPQLADRKIYFDQLNLILSQIQFLYSSISILNQSSFASHGRKRLDIFQNNLHKYHQKFQQIQHYAQVKFGYEYERAFQRAHDEDGDEEQSNKLLQEYGSNEQIELNLLQQQTLVVGHLERNLDDLRGTFVDLNRIIDEQGIIVDNIEQSLTDTEEMIEQATEKVVSTVLLKRRSNRLKWILIIFFICFFLLLIVIIFLAVKLAPSPYSYG